MGSSAEAGAAAVGRPLVGRHALVTGASRGIGRAVAAALAAAGARVALVARGEAALRAAAAAAGGEAYPADVTEDAAVASLVATVGSAWGVDAPDILVNAAGAFVLAPVAETPVAELDRMLAVNLRAPFLLMRAFLPAMVARGSGHIVTLGSIAGRAAFPNNGGYSASKFGVRGLHAVLDAELRGTGVRATLVEPAATDTPLWDEVDRAANPGLPEPAAMLSVEDVADAVLYAVTRPPAVDVRNLILERS